MAALVSNADLLRKSLEIERSRRDFPWFAANFLRIVTKEAVVKPLELYPFQLDLWHAMQAQQARQGYVRQLWIKSRQLGSTTLAQAIVFWRAALNPNTTGIIVAHNIGTTQLIFEKAKTFYDHLPPWMRPMVKYATRDELVFANPADRGAKSQHPGLNSRLIISTARNIHSGAGATVQIYHLSESARFPNPREIASSTLQAVPPAPGTFGIIESTARPEGHWFRAMCDAALAGESDFECHFIGWPQDPTARIAVREGETFTRDLAEDALAQALDLDDAQLKWRRARLADYLGDEATFAMDYPTTFEEAWTTREFSVFMPEHLRWLRTGLAAPMYRAQPAPGRFLRDLSGPLFVWEEPQPGVMYDIGADVSLGVRQDYSTAVVLKRPTHEQVAEYRTDRVAPREFAEALIHLGHAYNTAQIVCEANNIGRWTNAELIQNYGNLFIDRRIDRLDHKRSSYVGFETTQRSKPTLVWRAKDRVYRWVQAEDYLKYPLIRSEQLVRELTTFIHDPETGGFQAAPGEGHHDDTVMAWLLALRGSYDDEGMVSTARVDEPVVRERRDRARYLQPHEAMAGTAARGASMFGDLEGWRH